MKPCIRGIVSMLMIAAPEVVLAQADENQAYVITRPERTIEQVDAAYAAMPPVSFAPPVTRWERLPRTAGILASESGTLRVLMLGDSIVNDTSRSCWDLVLQRSYPRVKIVKTTCVRGGTGCWWYKTPERLQRYVIGLKPDLLIIGGISQRDDIASIAAVVDAARAKLGCDVLLMTPAFGTVDPRDDKQWHAALDPHGADYRSRLAKLADEKHLALLDMTAAWGGYIRSSGKPLDWFKRDEVHANERGEQILGRVLAAHLAPPVATPSRRD